MSKWIWKDQLDLCPCGGKGSVYSRRLLKYASRTCPKCLGAKQVVVQTATWKYIPVTILVLAGLIFLSWLAVVTTPSNFEGVVPTPIGLAHGLKMAAPVALDPPPTETQWLKDLVIWTMDTYGKTAMLILTVLELRYTTFTIWLAGLTIQALFTILVILVLLVTLGWKHPKWAVIGGALIGVISSLVMSAYQLMLYDGWGWFFVPLQWILIFLTAFFMRGGTIKTTPPIQSEVIDYEPGQSCPRRQAKTREGIGVTMSTK